MEKRTKINCGYEYICRVRHLSTPVAKIWNTIKFTLKWFFTSLKFVKSMNQLNDIFHFDSIIISRCEAFIWPIQPIPNRGTEAQLNIQVNEPQNGMNAKGSQTVKLLLSHHSTAEWNIWILLRRIIVKYETKVFQYISFDRFRWAVQSSI